MHGDMHGSKSGNRAYLDGHKDVVPGLQDTHDAKPPLKFTFRHETVSGTYHAVVWLNNTGLYGERLDAVMRSRRKCNSAAGEKQKSRPE
jgi:prepilin-type processing-associated H-X9-DG protein